MIIRIGLLQIAVVILKCPHLFIQSLPTTDRFIKTAARSEMIVGVTESICTIEPREPVAKIEACK